MGYPLITVRRNYDDRSARVTQERFLVGKKDQVCDVFYVLFHSDNLSLQNSESSSYSWWVPLTFSYPKNGFNNTYSKNWLRKGEKSRIVTDLPDSLTPVIFNVQQTGYYRYHCLTSNITRVNSNYSESIMTRRTGS